MAEAIALVVAGSGEITDEEIEDLLNDAYPDSVDISLMVPVDKEFFTDAVQGVLAWSGSNDDVYAINTKGQPIHRNAKSIGDVDEVDSLKKILRSTEYADWDDVHFLLAMPEDEDDPNYDLYAEMAEVAIENGLTVKNLCKGLEDVILADDEPAPEPEPEPEPEKAKPARRSRAKKAEPVEEPPPVEDVHDEVAAAVREQEPAQIGSSRDEQIFEALGNVVEALLVLREAFAPSPAPEVLQEAAEAPEEAAEDKPSSRGRGRPRENFEVPQIYDEDEKEWIPRPKGRMKKGTKWRKVHAETGEILDEGES